MIKQKPSARKLNDKVVDFKRSGRMKGAVIASWEGFIIEAALSGEAEKFESGRAGWTGWRGGRHALL